MADLQTIMQALRNADAAGNTADAQRLAMLAQQYQNTPSADPNAPDTGLMTGIANRALAIGEGLTDFLPTVAKAVTGYENPRIYIDAGDDGFQLGDLRTARLMDEKDLPTGTKNPFGFTGREFENAADFLADKREALNYAPKVPWNEVKSNPSPQNVLGFMGEAAITSLPDMAAALISAPAYFASYVAPIAQQRAENDGGRDVTPEDLAYAAVASAGIASAERFGAKGIFGDVYGNVAQRITGAGAREGATEAIQNPLQYAAETVDTQTGFDPIEAVDQAAAGLVGGTGAGVGLRTATEVATGGSMREAEDREAAAALANRLDATAKADSLNPRNVSNRVSTKGARALLDQTHVELSEEIQESYDNLGKAIKKDKTDDAETQRLKRLAKAGLRQAKNKVKNTVGTREMDAVRTLVGNTREGQQLINLMRESNELTTLHNRGLKGGLSKYTDMLAPLSSGSGYNPRPLIEVPTRAALTGTAAINTGGASLVPQAAIYAGGRLVDMVTGKRSNVANFIKNNKDAANLPAATGINIDESRVNQKEPDEKQKKINRQLFDENAPIVGNPNKPSPQLIMHENTGLDRQGIYNAAEEMKADPKYDTIKDELNQVQRSITVGGQIPNINAVAALMAGYLGVRAEQTTRVAPLRQAQIQQGINDNRERIESLRQQAMQDNSLSESDRQLLNDALDDLRRDLGTNPVDTAERIVSSAGALAENKASVTKYLNPYLDRVRQQQKRKKSEPELDYLEPPTETPEDLGFPRRDVDIKFMADRDAAYDLRNRLDSLLGYVFDVPKRDKAAFMEQVKKEGAKRLTDPDGRETLSFINAGKFGEEGLTPEQVEKLAPFLVDFFNFVEGSPDRGVLGSFQAREDSMENVVGGEIEVVDIDQPIGSGKMHIYQFMDTVFHELGHPIEAKSNLRSFLTQLSYLKGPPNPEMDALLEDGMTRQGFKEAVKASKARRPFTWERLTEGLDNYEAVLGFRPLKLEILRQDLRDGVPITGLDMVDAHRQAMELAEQKGRIELTEDRRLDDMVDQLKGAINYLYKPAELGADAVAFYMQDPARLKKMYPDLAKMVRAAVNNSDVAKYITFHSLAGLLGVSGVLSAMQAAIDGDDEDSPGIFRQMLGQGALNAA